MSDRVLAIVTNYKRPENVPLVCESLRAQTHPVTLVVVDNSPGPSRLRFTAAAQTPNDIWRFKANAGPPCRFAPAWMRHDHDYVLFVDDDMTLRPTAVEYLRGAADRLCGGFATLGQIGRIYGGEPGKWEYVRQNVPRRQRVVPVDLTCRLHFVRMDLMHHVLAFKWRVLDTFPEMSKHVGREDDMLLCQGIQWACRVPSYLVPRVMTVPRTRLIRKELPPGPHSQNGQADHVTNRTELANAAHAVGWRRQFDPAVTGT